MIKRLPIAVLVCLLVSSAALGQDDEIRSRPNDMEGQQRWFFGGNFGLTFGDFTFINISPQAGYRITPMLSAGGGVNFILQSNKIYYQPNIEEKSQYGYAGINVFGRVNPLKFLLINVQPEMNYVWGKTTRNPGGYEYKQDSKIVPSVLLGGGLVIPTGARGSMIAMLQYDIVQDPLSPYGSNMFFSFGFNF